MIAFGGVATWIVLLQLLIVEFTVGVKLAQVDPLGAAEDSLRVAEDSLSLPSPEDPLEPWGTGRKKDKPYVTDAMKDAFEKFEKGELNLKKPFRDEPEKKPFGLSEEQWEAHKAAMAEAHKRALEKQKISSAKRGHQKEVKELLGAVLENVTYGDRPVFQSLENIAKDVEDELLDTNELKSLNASVISMGSIGQEGTTIEENFDKVANVMNNSTAVLGKILKSGALGRVRHEGKPMNEALGDGYQQIFKRIVDKTRIRSPRAAGEQSGQKSKAAGEHFPAPGEVGAAVASAMAMEERLERPDRLKRARVSEHGHGNEAGDQLGAMITRVVMNDVTYKGKQVLDSLDDMAKDVAGELGESEESKRLMSFMTSMVSPDWKKASFEEVTKRSLRALTDGVTLSEKVLSSGMFGKVKHGGGKSMRDTLGKGAKGGVVGSFKMVERELKEAMDREGISQ